MSNYTNLKNKLKQFGIEIDPKKIYRQKVAGKRDNIFDREDPIYYWKADPCWDLGALAGKKASFYDAEIKYASHVSIDSENRREKDEEREWYGTEYHYADLILRKKSHPEKIETFTIGYAC